MKTLLNFVIALVLLGWSTSPVSANATAWWEFQAVDTMKYSRDLSGELLENPQKLKQITDQQVKSIADLGATHVAIATPYDEKFLPVLKEWVAAARRYGLKVWFRGNLSGWEEWFGFPRISREEHLKKIGEFIRNNPTLFENGDYFSACPECENGGPGDPRRTGDVAGYRQFLIAEYQEQLQAFRDINKNVQVNLNSMNGDVAKLVMDKATTTALGGQVVVDHYVETPAELDQDITAFAEASGGKVILGEFGAPIPDIHGHMTEEQQAEWLKQSFHLLAQNPNLVGLSYWTNVGGSTSLWTEDGTPKQAAQVVKVAFTPRVLTGKVVNPLDQEVQATLRLGPKTVTTENGSYQLPYIDETGIVRVSANGYAGQEYYVTELQQHPVIELIPTRPSLWYRLQAWVRQLSSRLGF